MAGSSARGSPERGRTLSVGAKIIGARIVNQASGRGRSFKLRYFALRTTPAIT